MIMARSLTLFNRPLLGLRLGLLPIPAMNRWAIFNRPLTRAWRTLFVQSGLDALLQNLFQVWIKS
jgi:hypothetical protein